MTTMYLEYELKAVLASGRGGKLAGFPVPDPVKERLLPVVKLLDQLSTAFGLSPCSQPVFFSWAEALPPHIAKGLAADLREYIGRQSPHEVRAWTPRGEPHRPRLALSEFDGAQQRWAGRSAEALLRTACHEFGHRLQLEKLVDWEWDLSGGDCSSEVVKFAEFVSKRYTGMVNLADNWGRGYRDLARACRVKARLPAELSFAELGGIR